MSDANVLLQKESIRVRSITVEEIPCLINILANAYPRIPLHTDEERQQFHDRIVHLQSENAESRYLGLFHHDELLGCMRTYEFEMHMLSQDIPVSGVGMVAVDFAHKREKIGKNLIFSWLHACHADGIPITLLYAFRTDFYHNMGFGFGPKRHRYRIPPARLPKGTQKKNVRLSTRDDLLQLQECYDRCYNQTHGLLRRSTIDFEGWLTNKSVRVASYSVDERIEGYLVFEFKPGHTENFGINELHIREFVYENGTALGELLFFLQSQSDQIQTIVLNTFDDDFYTLIDDARNDSGNLIPHVFHETNTSGVGLMYRVTHVKELFQSLRSHSFAHIDCTVKLSIRDNAILENNGSTIVQFVDGFPSVQPDGSPYDVEVSMDIADFSALIMGVISFTKILRYGKAAISDGAFTETIHQLFLVDEPPICLTAF